MKILHFKVLQTNGAIRFSRVACGKGAESKMLKVLQDKLNDGTYSEVTMEEYNFNVSRLRKC